MASSHSIRLSRDTQHSEGLSDAEAVLDLVDPSTLIEKLWAYRWNGRPGYSLNALWRAHLLRHLLNLPSVNALIRRLQDDPRLRRLCGFDQMPHRSTFNRFFARLSHHQDLVDKATASLTDQLARLLPGFGEEVAVDSTNISTHSNPDRSTISDPEASWTAKTKTHTSKNKLEWHFGYKYHSLVDARYGLPITGFTTTASRSDNPTLPALLDKAAKTHDWFSPSHIMADKGYDSEANHREAMDRGVVPIIPIKRLPRGATREGILDDNGVPLCVGNIPMEYVATDPEQGHLYRCAPEGCKLADRRGVRYCDDSTWVHWRDAPRVVGPVRRDTQEWRDLYGLRQSAERVFKSLKQSRALDDHCQRGLLKVGLHASLSVLAFQATALRRLLAGQVKFLRWQVPRVA